MRHRKSGRQLNRNSSYRTVMFKNMTSRRLELETIKTTLPKAKELRRETGPVYTLTNVEHGAKRRYAVTGRRAKRNRST